MMEVNELFWPLKTIKIHFVEDWTPPKGVLKSIYTASKNASIYILVGEWLVKETYHLLTPRGFLL